MLEYHAKHLFKVMQKLSKNVRKKVAFHLTGIGNQHYFLKFLFLHFLCDYVIVLLFCVQQWMASIDI